MHARSKDLAQFFSPRSIAIIGVTRKPGAFGGGTFLEKLLECGFQGNLYPINPKAHEIQGVKAYSSLLALPETPDLAIVSVAAHTVPEALEDCARAGVRHIHILASGFSETRTKEGLELEERIVSVCERNGLLVIGPNCMGPYCPSSSLTAWGAIPGMTGPVGVISQSGAMTQRLTEYLCSLGVGVEKAVSMGNAALLDSTDYLEFMGEDQKIRLIAMYLESVKDGRRLLGLAREIGKEKPIIILKGGESEVGAKTVISHTGSLAGEQRLWEAFFRQTGAVHVRSMNEWVDSILALSQLPAAKGNGVFLVGGGGGNSVASSDTCIREGLDVPLLSGATMEKMREMVPVAGSIAGNPLDTWRTYDDPEYLKRILELGYKDPRVSMVVVDRLIPRAAFHGSGRNHATPEIIEFVKARQQGKPTIFTVDYDGGDPDLTSRGMTLRAELCRAGLPTYPSLSRAARALAHLYRYYARFN